MAWCFQIKVTLTNEATVKKDPKTEVKIFFSCGNFKYSGKNMQNAISHISLNVPSVNATLI